MPPPSDSPNGADTTGFGENLIACVIPWNCRISEIHVVPLFFLHAHQQQHQIRADGKIRRVVGDHERVEVVARARQASGV